MNQNFKVDDLVEYIGDSDVVIGLHKGAVYKIYNLCFGGYVRLYEFVQGPAFELKKFKPHKSPKELNKTTFKVGDIVEAFGCEGTVKQIATGCTYPIQVALASEHYHWFTLDGKLSDWHKTPSLKLVSRPKKIVTKTVEAWVNVYSDGSRVVHVFKDKADEMAVSNRIACVKLTGTYEIEVEQED